MNDIENAKRILNEPGMTCVLCRGDTVYTSSKPGISPMLDYLEDGTPLCGFSAADKVVGKAAAMLFALAGVKEVFGEVMSSSALPVFAEHGILASYTTLTGQITNRAGDGCCPMELTVCETDDLKKAEAALRETRKRLMSKG